MISHPQKHPAGTRPDISISNRQRARKMDLRLLKKITAATLVELKIEQVELGIVLVGAKEMASLNEEFLGHEGATDVITFNYSEPKVAPPDAISSRDGALRRQRRVQRRNSVVGRSTAHVLAIHGEVFICVSEAERQAKLFGTNWLSEVARYIVHGILHLAGYDDLEPVARKRMKKEENRLLRKTVTLM